MKMIATLALLLALAAPASAAVVHDEAVHGDLSTNPAVPTALNFLAGGNTIKGTVFNSNVANPTGDRDYITFTIPDGARLVALNMPVWSPFNLGFAFFNAGNTSFVPSAATDPMILSGIHPFGDWVGTDILPRFVTDAATSNSLPAAELGPGTYCFMVQQTSNLVTTYEFEFVLGAVVSAAPATWGRVKALYR